MDPTKSFEHLDPKLKETYARVMGTTASDSSATNSTPAQADQVLTTTPTTFDPAQPMADPNAQLNTQPSAQGPNPGTGPTVTNLPTDASSILTSQAVPSEGPISDPNTPSVPTEQPAPDQNIQSSPSTFFSNPSPAATDTTQPSLTPVTPYSPEEFNGNPQPLPSPASVNQQEEHKTSPLLKVLYIIGAVIFFAVYTIFWIKVFNLPFLF